MSDRDGTPTVAWPGTTDHEVIAGVDETTGDVESAPCRCGYPDAHPGSDEADALIAAAVDQIDRHEALRAHWLSELAAVQVRVARLATAIAAGRRVRSGLFDSEGPPLDPSALDLEAHAIGGLLADEEGDR